MFAPDNIVYLLDVSNDILANFLAFITYKDAWFCNAWFEILNNIVPAVCAWL